MAHARSPAYGRAYYSCGTTTKLNGYPNSRAEAKVCTQEAARLARLRNLKCELLGQRRGRGEESLAKTAMSFGICGRRAAHIFTAPNTDSWRADSEGFGSASPAVGRQSLTGGSK